MLGVRLPVDLENRLNLLVETTHRSKSYYVKKALTAFLDDAEDLYRAEKVSERLKDGQEKTYTLAEVIASLKASHNDLDH